MNKTQVAAASLIIGSNVKSASEGEGGLLSLIPFPKFQLTPEAKIEADRVVSEGENKLKSMLTKGRLYGGTYGAGLGALAGGTIGALTGDREKRKRRAVLGALLGAGIGGVGGGIIGDQSVKSDLEYQLGSKGLDLIRQLRGND